MINNGGLDTEQDYPYNAMDGVCDFMKESWDPAGDQIVLLSKHPATTTNQTFSNHDPG